MSQPLTALSVSRYCLRLVWMLSYTTPKQETSLTSENRIQIDFTLVKKNKTIANTSIIILKFQLSVCLYIQGFSGGRMTSTLWSPF